MKSTPDPFDVLIVRSILFVAILHLVALLLATLLAYGYDPRAALMAVSGFAVLAVQLANRLIKA